MQQIPNNYWNHNSAEVRSILTKLCNLHKVEHNHSKFQNEPFVWPRVRKAIEIVLPPPQVGLLSSFENNSSLFLKCQRMSSKMFLNLKNSHG